MEKGNHQDGKDLPPELNRIKEQIERERFEHIKKTFELRYKPSVTAHGLHHQSLALTRSGADDNSGRKDNNMLALRMAKPLHRFNGFSTDQNDVYDDISDEEDTFKSVELPFVEKLPKFITWTFTNRNQLMDESDSVIGMEQIYYVDGEAIELSSDSDEYEEAEKEKLEFSKDVDQFIWRIGQEYGLDDLVVQSALSQFLGLDASAILERYNELIMLTKNEGNIENIEDSDSSFKSTINSLMKNINMSFCRRCLIFNCGMHDNSQPMVKPREKQTNNMSENEDVREPCSELCYLKLRSVTEGGNVVDTNTETEDFLTLSDTNEVTKDMSMLWHQASSKEWTPVEKDLYLKGIEIFGRNSCLIRRNILSGLKTCIEIYDYMREQDKSTMSVEHKKTAETKNQVNKQVTRKSSKCKRRLRKYARCPPALKQQVKGEDKEYKQYTPCTCESICGDQCICLSNGNCCEKYCGCPKICKNRFEGCNCFKGQCGNRQCPCFAASRECDPDLCRSCSLSCGDGSLGKTSEESQCKNMKFLLKKHKKILLAKSDVNGWGAFTRDSLKKNEFIGEYTGELITHGEANERGRADNRLGSSYLFTLNDQLEIDARRKGNKFRFLNHSAKPNCYSKMMIVRGDHRIGIYANRAIVEGEELFFDYCYGSGQLPSWSRSRKPRESGVSKKFKGVGPST